MHTLPTHWPALVAVVFFLGLKHGLDADHLAAIDGLTRFNSGRHPRLSRWSGALFSSGHGVVVTLVAIAVATVATGWQAPGWLEDAGSWLSIAFLTLLGVANLGAVLRTPRGEVVRVVGFRGRLFQRLMRVEHPVLIAAVGATFAVSFDTMSYAVLFSVTGSHLAGWLFAALLGVLFTLGMVATDTLNGLWVSRLVARADERAAAASRAMSVAIGLLALGVAALGAARHAVPAFDERIDSFGVVTGLAVIALATLGYAYAMRRAGEPS